MADPTPTPTPTSGYGDIWGEEPTTPEKGKQALGPLFESLKRLGLVPVDTNEESGIPYYLQDPKQFPAASIFADPNSGILYDDQATALPKWMSDQVYDRYGASSGGGGSGGGGGDGGLTAYQQAMMGQQAEQEAYQRQQDAMKWERQGQRDVIGDALDTLAAIRTQQQSYDQRAAQSQSSFLDALGYAVAPGQTHFPGLGENDIAVQLGLAAPQKIVQTPFDPNAVLRNPYDQQLQQQLGVYQGLTGA